MKVRAAWTAAIGLSLLLLLSFGTSVYRFYQGSAPPGGEAVRISIPQGTGFRGVCDTLRARGVVEETRWLYWVGRLGGAHRNIRAGRYRIVPGTPPGQVLRLLQRGANEVVRVIVPEGLWLDETAAILAERLEFTADEFLQVAEGDRAAERFGVPGPTLEGYLFPETYLFFPNETVDSVIRRMTGRFRKALGEEEMARADSLGFTPREIATLASIVEGEAMVDEERPRIAAVFHNRLRQGWPLQADPTVHYAHRSRAPLLIRDLEIDSPYNTYKTKGLPPGPICAPGGASIRAVLHPTEGSREFYFVASGEGGRHVFSTNSADHERARREARRNRNSP